MDSGSGEGSSRSSMMDDPEFLSSTTDAELLKRAWRTEKAAPEILQFEAALVQRSREQIQLVEETVEESMAGGVDPLIVSLHQMDLDRTLFLLRSYLRIRLQKIEKYMVHIHKTTELWNRLSKQEQKFAKRCIEDLEDHFEKSVLSTLPDRYKSSLKQSVISEEDDMVPEPPLDSYVICRTQKSLGALQLDNSGEEDPVDLDPNDLYAVRYNSIKPLVYSGRIDLV
ncbi:DNA replication complex GINS protein SLD5 [Diospyros lotus]|uniref:DNA replication complex GINS protein SLD5 n=1 Tax=Diospyros lotus TaxID=55363 RepID=UPI0022510861|nr:DNA replication complex GINS protein SLD5 [Diospyros lotus]XP_052188409.1 DNA replication complex GINS protein SLD5 [Diospyros lotus]